MGRRLLKLSVVVGSVVLCGPTIFRGPNDWADVVHAQEGRPRAEAPVRVRPVQGNIYMIAAGGSNITASVGVDGVMLVDAGPAELGEKVLEAVGQLNTDVNATPEPPITCVGRRCPGGAGAGARNEWGFSGAGINALVDSPPPLNPIRYLINTSVDPDHTGGNLTVGGSGRTFTGANISLQFNYGGEGAEIWAYETVLNRMTEEAKIPETAWPGATYFSPTYKWSEFFNGEGIELHYVPAAHTDGDTMVYFRYSDVLSAGDILRVDTYPVIDVEKGGTIQGMIDGLHKILDIAIPQYRSEGGTYIVPGHGRICDVGDVANYRNMVVKIRDRIREMSGSGMTLDQVKAARPTLDYDGRYGSPDKFIEAVYRTLDAKK